MSDGTYLYWLYLLKGAESVTHPMLGEKVKQHSVYLQVLGSKVRLGLRPLMCLVVFVRELCRCKFSQGLECVDRCMYTFVCNDVP